MPDWPHLLREHGPSVWRAIHHVLGPDGEADDCFQEAFTRAMLASRAKPVAQWGGFLRALAIQASLDHLRRRLRRTARVSCAENLDTSPGDHTGPSEHAESAELSAALRAALADLPEAQAAAFSLRHFEQLSYERIAQALGLEASAVGVLLHRARGRLAEMLQAWDVDAKGSRHAR